MIAAFRHLVVLLVVSILVAGPASGVSPDERLQDPELEAKARDITKELRCLVCQNQSIDDSDAGLAKELRMLVRERVLAGDSKKEVLDVVVGIHGEYVLLRPRWGLHTAALWLGPFFLLAFGFLVARGLFRVEASADGHEPSENEAKLSDEQKKILNELRE